MRRLAPLAALVLLALVAGSCGRQATTTTAPATTAATAAATATTVAPATTATTVATTAASATTSSTTAPACSATGLGAAVPAEDLPATVGEMRSDLARAAVACDWTTLQALAERVGSGLRFTFGDERNAVTYWREQERATGVVPPMRALRLLLGLPFGTQTLPNGTVQYVWPAAFAAEHPTDAQLEEIADTGLYPMATLRRWVESGNNYLGYRIVITGNGDWTVFVEGD